MMSRNTTRATVLSLTVAVLLACATISAMGSTVPSSRTVFA